MPTEREASAEVESLERALEESRRIRERSSLLLKKAQWPLTEDPAQDEEAAPVLAGSGVISGA